MHGKTWAGSAAGLLLVAGVVGGAQAHDYSASRDLEALAATNARRGAVTLPTDAPHVGHRGGTVVLDTHGLLVAERNAAAVIRADRNGEAVAALEFAGTLGELVTDGDALSFVADRAGNRLVRLDTSQDDSLLEDTSVTVAEPYGLGLSPDGATVYVTSVADHALIAFDTKTMKEAWSVKLRAEPRGIAVSTDGTRATVGFLSSGALAEVYLDTNGETVRWHALDPRDHVKVEMEFDDWGDGKIPVASISEARSRFSVPTDQGRRHARNVFSVAYVGHGQVVAPHQVATPQMRRVPSRGMQDSYGGGPQEVPPIDHRLAVVSPRVAGQAKVQVSKLQHVHQPRAMAYDASLDRLYVAGYGDDDIVGISDVSLPSAYSAWRMHRRRDTGNNACGADGMVVDGGTLWVHCELSRKLLRVRPDQLKLDDKPWHTESAVSVGPELAASKRGESVERGAELFRRGESSQISDSGTMACASCHPEGRQDGLSWRLGGAILQTPMLAGRLGGTEPYKWGGLDATLNKSFKHTIERLGGSSLSRSERDDLAAYVRWLPTATRPTVASASAVQRGKSLFEDTLECSACHAGEAMADGNQYPFDAWGLEETDTPSLKGLAHTAPYYHDGSAVDLWALVTDKGSVHDMADFSELTSPQAHDLVAYLETL
ncbi:MAG: c-type cytochrome [Nannocystales bacterium]